MLRAIRITKEELKLPQNLTECSKMCCKQCCFQDYNGSHCSYRKMLRKYTLQS